ncbi:MAG: NADH:ubiquinone reductase (Na(+)-transporting) subunit C [Microscillaceae bacterium]|jgi:Na+-transporting NADH:ubiquinone oxidoreductase subunit C|nr:NADH:ubiquinone reductase (Na(+)-transporting) subunit C [Microscillaceae bacterium]
MQQSNGYVITYTVILTLVCAIALALASLGLKPFQDANKELEKKQNILATVMTIKNREEVKDIYKKRVKSYVIDFNGKMLEGKVAEDIDVVAEYKKKAQERQLPIYEILSEDGSKSEYFVLPVYGFGLWNDIWGFVALKGDLNTINGVKFEHKGETPGLGARIATDEIQVRYKDKKIFEGENLASVIMAKGELGGGDASVEAFKGKDHEIDGMSGATITGKGLTAMLKDYLGCYEKFIKAKKAKS